MTNTKVYWNCKICGSYTQSPFFESRSLCPICGNQMTKWTKEELIRKLADTQKILRNLEHSYEIPNECSECEYFKGLVIHCGQLAGQPCSKRTS